MAKWSFSIAGAVRRAAKSKDKLAASRARSKRLGEMLKAQNKINKAAGYSGMNEKAIRAAGLRSMAKAERAKAAKLRQVLREDVHDLNLRLRQNVKFGRLGVEQTKWHLKNPQYGGKATPKTLERARRNLKKYLAEKKKYGKPGARGIRRVNSIAAKRRKAAK